MKLLFLPHINAQVIQLKNNNEKFVCLYKGFNPKKKYMSVKNGIQTFQRVTNDEVSNFVKKCAQFHQDLRNFIETHDDFLEDVSN